MNYKQKMCLSFLIIILLLIGLSSNVLAKDTPTYTATSTINGITINWQYELNDENQIENLKCTNISDIKGNIEIPSTIDGKTIVSVGFNAFKASTGLTSIKIPSSVTEIGYSAFENCSNLTSVNLGNIQSIDFKAFKGCTSLENITIPKSLKAGSVEPIFDGCTKLSTITLEDGLTIVPSYLCANTNITSIEIPSSVTEIEHSAFNNCNELKKITILDNVKEMGWFSLKTDEDSVFSNHNDDLTIYCYENSIPAQYAIHYNIKYVYLKKPSSSNGSISSSETSGGSTTNIKKYDSTTAIGSLPRAGLGIGFIVIIAIVLGSSIFVFFRCRNLKDV